MKKSKLIDKIIKEPLGGAHYDREKTFKYVENEILKAFKALDLMDASELVNTRRAKFIEMGVFDG
jgi:acetyl-CoA carboxylase carboxyl transferase subunit alpha